MYILDTDHITLLQRRPQSALADRISKRGEQRFFVSIVSFHEQAVGWHAYLNQAQARKKGSELVYGYRMLQAILEQYTDMAVLPFDDTVLLRVEGLASHNLQIGAMDLRIAATALCHGFTVLSANLRDFENVPGLVAEDWS